MAITLKDVEQGSPHEAHRAVELPLAGFWAAAFDIMFFTVFIVGILITTHLNPEIVKDNPIARAFHGNNLCIFVDFGPAHVLANGIMGLSLVPYTMYAFTLRMDMLEFAENKRVANVNSVILGVGLVCSSAFGMAIGIQPQFHSPTSVYFHTGGFALGCLGFALMKASQTIGFWNQNPGPWSFWQKAHFGVLVPTGPWLFVNAATLAYGLAVVDIAANLKVPFKGSPSLFVGNIPLFQSFWTVTVAFLIVLGWLVRPEPSKQNRLKVSPLSPARYGPMPSEQDQLKVSATSPHSEHADGPHLLAQNSL